MNGPRNSNEITAGASRGAARARGPATLRPAVGWLLILSVIPLPAASHAAPAGLSSAERRIVAAVERHAPEALGLLERAVLINSGTMNFEGVREVGRLFEPEFRSLGFETRWVEGAAWGRAGHLIATRPGRAGGLRVLLIGHLDTVFERDSPFQRFERLDDSTARGPGVIDMKGGDVIMLLALRALAETGGLDRMNVTAILTGDEEKSGEPLELARRDLVAAAERADVAIGFEDGDGDPRHAVIGRRGASRWILRVAGQPAHSSQIFREEIGSGAIYEAARILQAFRDSLSEEPYLTINPGVIVGGTAVTLDPEASRGTAFGKDNVIAESTAVTGDLRTLSLEQRERAKATLRRIVAASPPHAGASIEFMDGYPPFAPSEGNRRLLAEVDRASRDLGFGPVEATDPSRAGAADVSFTGGRTAMGIDAMGLKGDGGHTVRETAILTTLPTQAKRAATVLSRLAARGAPAAAHSAPGPAQSAPAPAQSAPTPAQSAPAAAAPAQSAPAPAPAYPPARRGDVVEQMHGVAVADPYRWLEDLDSPETRAWLDAERATTRQRLAGLPGRDRIERELLAAYDYEKVSAPVERGGRLFYTRNAGLQDQPVLLVEEPGTSRPRALADFNQISPDGKLAYAGFSVSPRGRYVAYGLSIAGGDWTEWRVREVASGRDLPDRLEWTKYYAPAWTADESALYYSRFPRPAAGGELTAQDLGCKVHRHRLGTRAEDDRVVYGRPEHPTWQFDPTVTEDGRWLVVTIGDGQVGDRGLEEIHAFDLAARDARPLALVTGFDAEYLLVASQGSTFYLSTNLDAPRKRVIAVDARDPTRASWRTVIPESDQPINDVVRSGDKFYVSRLVDASSRLAVYALDGKALGEISLPGLGAAVPVRGQPAARDAYYVFTSFTAPPTVYRYDPETGRSESFHAPKAAIDPARYEVKEIFYPGKDGTRVPMFVVHLKGLVPDGSHATLLTGYGGFANSMTPRFNPLYAWWLGTGGVLAVPCLRGGAEYGEAWHQAAIKTRKQTTFDDFIAAAEWLIENRLTRPSRLAITGASNGGLLVGAALTQRPELFGAVVAHVGVLDMLRFHLVGQGQGWQGDFGSVAVPEEFRALYAYSPLHHVKPGTSYPPTLIVTGDHDTRVAPWHSFKFAAALQSAQGGTAPVLLKLESTAGHGGGTRLRARISDYCEIYAFVLQALGVSP